MCSSKYTLYLILLIICGNASGQAADKHSFRLYSRLSFYSFERSGELLLHVPESLNQKNISFLAMSGSDTLAEWEGRCADKITRIPFEIKLQPMVYRIDARIIVTGQSKKFQAVTNLVILPYKPNEVKTDRLTGGLIVNKRPFFPFGFYCYSPVDMSLPEEESIRGFNMISPYQKIAPETSSERKAYMDRCAQLGMKVHFNLLSVSGGGGVGSRIDGLSSEDKKRRLLDEIAMFRDHPALLGWYIADEPNGYKIPPAELEEIYKIVNENDPWHPVSIVFMAPFTVAKDYEDALDVVMADPYPLPDLPASMVGNVAGQLKQSFSGRRPVWMVPQAFGGGELWSREPTVQELRSMTWQSILNGATGIQYFVRQGPNYFPKSPATWSECGRMAMEVSELTPWLLSDEKANSIEASSRDIIASSKLHGGKLVIMVVNKVNQPVNSTIRISGIVNAKARSLFENRYVNVQGGILSDYLPAFGSCAYLINLAEEKPVVSLRENLLTDPGFEDPASPGIPSACYVRPGGDRGATYFLDSREHFDGDHSLRLITPEKDKSVSIRFYPFTMKAGSSYVISLRAKSDPEQRFRVVSEEEKKLPARISEPQYVEIRIGDVCRAWFVPGSEWKQYVTFVTIPADTTAKFKANLILRMPGQGVAWFDQLRIEEEK